MIYSSNSMNTFRPREDDLKYTLTILNGNTWILIQIPMMYIPKGPVGSKSALFQKRLVIVLATSHYMNQW